MADNFVDARAAVGLRVFHMTGQRVDEIPGEVGAIRGRQRSAFFALEVIMQDQFLVVLGKNEVDAGSLEISVKKQQRVRHDNGAGRNMGGVRRLDMAIRIGMRNRNVSRRISVELTGVIQWATAKVKFFNWFLV